MRALLLVSIALGLLASTDATAANYRPSRHTLSMKQKKQQKEKKKPQKKGKEKYQVYCKPSKGKHPGKLAKHCKRAKFKIVTEGHALSENVTGGEVFSPEGWLHLKSAHSGESVCVNIFSGETCGSRKTIGELLQSKAKSTDGTQETKTADSLPEGSKEVLVAKEPSDPKDGAMTNVDSEQTPKETSTDVAEVGPSKKEDVKSEVLEQGGESTEEDSTASVALSEGEGGALESENSEGGEKGVVAGVVTDAYTQDTFVESDITIHPEAQAAINTLFRDRKTGHTKPVHPRLILKLSALCEHFKKQILLVSGYRNQKHTTSRHYGARASDIQIPGVPIEEIRTFAQRGNKYAIGIGLYPNSGFIHLDARDNPSYLWVQHVVPIKRGRLGRKGSGGKRISHSKSIASKSRSSSRRNS